MLHFERLQALHAVSTFGSVTGAAGALRLTPSAVSQQLSKLQRDVGQRLIEPYGRGVRLTPAGALLATRAHAILSEVESAESELDRQRAHVIGDLEIAGFATAARAILPQTVARLRKEHQQLTLRVSERQPDEAIRLVVAGHLDIALVNDWMNAPLVLPNGVERLLIMNDAVDLAVPADHPLAERRSVELTELCSEHWITWPHGAICHEWLTQTLRQHGLTPRGDPHRRGASDPAGDGRRRPGHRSHAEVGPRADRWRRHHLAQARLLPPGLRHLAHFGLRAPRYRCHGVRSPRRCAEPS